MSRKSSFPIVRVAKRDGTDTVLEARGVKVSMVKQDWQASLVIKIGNKVDGYVTYNARVEPGINTEHLGWIDLHLCNMAALNCPKLRWFSGREFIKAKLDAPEHERTGPALGKYPCNQRRRIGASHPHRRCRGPHGIG